MTPDEFRARSCTSKIPFASRREARQRATPQQSRLGGGKVVPYRCKFEPHWHIGHAISKVNRKRNAA